MFILTKTPDAATHQNPHFGLTLLFTLLIIRIFTLGTYPLFDPSESRYAEMARKMLETNNWVTPLIDYGIPFWGKPPLTVWITAISLKYGFINEFFARLPSLILGIGIIWIIYYLVKIQKNAEAAKSIVIVLSSSVLFFLMSGTVAMDQCLTFGLTVSLTSFWLAIREHKSYWGYLFFLGLSVGLLAKGPIIIVLVSLNLGLWTLFTHRWQDVWNSIPWIKGTLLMLCISTPWFLIAEQKTPGFLEYFIIGEHWKRFTESGWNGDLYGIGHAHVRGIIWLYWLQACFPWSLVIIIKLIQNLRHKHKYPVIFDKDGWGLYSLLWMLSPLLFFTFSANVIWTYALPSLPGMALFFGEWLEFAKVYRVILALCVPIIFIGLVSAYHYPNMDFFKSQKQLIQIYQTQATSNERLFYFNNTPYSAQFYLQGKVSKISGDFALQYQLATSSHDYYILRQDELDRLPDALKNNLTLVKHYHSYILLHAKR